MSNTGGSFPGVDRGLEDLRVGQREVGWRERVNEVLRFGRDRRGVVLKPGVQATGTELREFVKRQVAAYKYPRHVWRLDELPKTAAALQDLGCLPGGCSDEEARALLARMRLRSAWRRAEAPTRLEPGRRRRDQGPAADAAQDGERRGDSGDSTTDAAANGAGDRRVRFRLPPEALLLRRMQGLLYLTAAKARATVAWGPLHRELLEDGEPLGELGSAHAEPAPRGGREPGGAR
jgi:AMP-binding enzyme C-terminal domain